MGTTLRFGGRERLRALLVALGLSLGGVAFGSLSALAVPVLYDALAPPGSPGNRLLHRYLVQPGFALLAVGYVAYRGETDRFVRLRRPPAEGVLWIASGVVLERGTRALSEAAFGAAHDGGPAKWEVMLADPLVIPLVLLVTFVLMAPAEELLYRGVIHGRLRGSFDVVPRVLVGAGLFGLLHLFLSGGVPSLVTTSLTGLALAVAYERTDTLVVPVGMHGVVWLLAPL